MKKQIVLFLALVVSVSVFAEVLFTEDFTNGMGTPVEGYNGWFTPYDGVSSIATSNGLEFAGYAMSGVGNAALLNGKSGQYQPHHSFTEVKEGSLYVAFLFQPTIVAKAGWFFSLRDAYSTSTFNYIARIHISEDGYLGLRFYTTAAAVYDETMPLDGQQPCLVVLKYTINEGDHNDAISLYAFDTMPADEPETPLIGVLADVQAPDITPQNIVLRAYDADSWLVIDGIRVATTWSEAVAGLNTALPNTANKPGAVSYTQLGQPAPTDYHGVVIRDGQKYLQ